MIGDGVNDWETGPAPVTEKEKKEYARQRITGELEGNPNIPKKKTRKIKFKPPTKEQEIRMSFLDRMGNPIEGYKWSGLDIVEVASGNIVSFGPKQVVDDTGIQILKTKSIKIKKTL